MSLNLSSLKMKKAASIFLALLVMTMPFYISVSLADEYNPNASVYGTDYDYLGSFGGITPLDGNSLSTASEKTDLLAIKSVSISGTDSIEGYRRSTDKTIVKVRLDMETGGVDRNQVWLGTISQFDSCSGTAEDDFECLISYPADPNTLDSRDYSYNVYYYNKTYADNVTVPDSLLYSDKKSATILVDSEAPTITSFEANPKTLGSGDITFSYIINDNSCDSARCSGYCAGLSNITFYKNVSGTVDVLESISGNGKCLSSGSFKISSDNLTNGTMDVYVIASDRFNQTSEPKSLSLNVNKEAPFISKLSVETPDGDPIEYVGSDPVNSVFVVLIEDSDLNTAKVTADFSKINGQGVKTAACDNMNGTYQCYWNNIMLNLQNSTDLVLNVTAVDLLANSANSTLSYHVNVDKTGPVVNSITTDKDPYILPDSKITVSLTETGIGLYKGNVYLDLTSIGMGKVKADSCSEGWTCTFSGITSSIEGKRFIVVSQDSTDDLGNPVTGNLTKIVANDMTPPSVLTANVSYVAGTYPLVDGQPTTGTTMEITATVNEESQLGAVADLSPFIEGVSALQGSCTNANNTWTCKWTTPAINRPGPYTANIALTFSDILGNNITRNLPVKVIGVNTDLQNPNYWASTVTCSPSLVDREVTPFVDMKVYCVVNLNSNNAKIVSMDMAGCQDLSSSPVAQQTNTGVTGTTLATNTAGSGWVVEGRSVGESTTTTTNVVNPTNTLASYASAGSYVASASLLNNANGSTSPVIEVVLARSQMNINKLTLSCPFSIISRVGDTIVMTPEIENTTINIYFYNNPQGDFGQGVQDKIDAAKKKAQGFWNILGWLHKIFFWAKKICDILYTISRVMVTFKGITDLHTTASIASMGTPAFPMIEGTRVKTCVIDDSIKKTHTYVFGFGDKFCEFINCKMTGGKDQKSSATDTSASTTDKNAAPAKEGTLKSAGKSVTQTFSSIGTGMSNWNQWGYSTLGKMDVGSFIKDNTGRDPSTYMNAKDNLVVALLTGCIPGIIAGLEKLRQIECMYGHCLQEGVKGDGVPITACEDQKDYAYCKYIFGELFALIPFTAFFDNFFGMIKGALSDPLSALAIPFAYICKPLCVPGDPVSWKTGMQFCGWIQVASLIGEIIGQVQGIINADSWKIKNDYCQMLMDESTNSSGGTSAA